MFRDIFAYCQGHIRMWLFYSRFSHWIPLHIFEQINYRLFRMDQKCYTNGACLLCGCATPALQMANKACDKPCYPEMMSAKDWETHKYFNRIQFIYRQSNSRDFELRITSEKIML